MKTHLKKGVIKRYRSMFFLPFLLAFHFNYAAIIYVNHAAVGASDGTSWANAFTSLSLALSAASNGDEIWVAKGVYLPSQLVDLNLSGGVDLREATFFIPDGVALYGGFAGGEMSLEDRDWQVHLTILSGDIDENDLNADGNSIAEDTDHIIGNNAYHVIYTENASAATRVDGFIITAGSASIAVPLSIADPNLDGGGWYNRLKAPDFRSSPTIINSRFYGNYAVSEGGALYNTPGPVGAEILSAIQNCVFSNNKADNTGGAIFLGSFSPGNYQPEVNNCKFEGNEAFRRGGAIYLVGDHSQINSSNFINNQVTAISTDGSTLPGSGGAVNLVSSNAKFSSCIFKDNKSTGNPTGAFEGGGGGAVYISTNDPQTSSLGTSTPEFLNCGFYSNIASENTAAWGGAIVHLNDAGILRPRYVNCVFSANQAQNDGGAIANYTRVISEPEGFTPLLNPTFTNCTFTGNQAGQRGGAIFNAGYMFMGTQILTSHIENSILWNNSAGVEGNEVYSTGSNFVAYSLIQGSGGSGGSWNSGIGTDGGNNIDDDPLFIDPLNPEGTDNIPATSDDGLRLSSGSPAINAGNNSAAGLTGITTDFTGMARISGSDVDMGAYERTAIIIPDLNIFWLTNWYKIDPPCLSCPPSWSFFLFDRLTFIPFYDWEGPAQLIVKEDHAIITGKIVNQKNPKYGFEVFLKLENPQDWKSWSAKRRTYVAYTPEAIKTARMKHKEWEFWELSEESYLKGIGDVSGILNLRHWLPNKKTGFQMGEGANGWDSDTGLGGWFAYSGKVSFKGRKISLHGFGSINVDIEQCLKDCTPLLLTEITPLALSPHSFSKDIYEEPGGIIIYPLPAKDFVSFDTRNIPPGNYEIQLVDMHGRVKTKSFLDTYDDKKTINLEGFVPGIYILQLIKPGEEIINKKLIIE